MSSFICGHFRRPLYDADFQGEQEVDSCQKNSPFYCTTKTWPSHSKLPLPAQNLSHSLCEHAHSPNNKAAPSTHINCTHPQRMPLHPLPNQSRRSPFPLFLLNHPTLILASTRSHTHKLPHTTPYKWDKRIMSHRRHQSSLIPKSLLTKPSLVKEQVGTRREKRNCIQPNDTPNPFIEETREPRWDYAFLRAFDFHLINLGPGRRCVAHEAATDR